MNAKQSKMEDYKRAADSIGVHFRTIIRWKKKGCNIKSSTELAAYAADHHVSKHSVTVLHKATQNIKPKTVSSNLFDWAESRTNDRIRREDLLVLLRARIKAKEVGKEARMLRSQIHNKRQSAPSGKKCLYLLKNRRNGYYKIGVSDDPEHREKTLQSEDPDVFSVGTWEDSEHMEKVWHKHFSKERLRGEWFLLTDAQVRFMVFKMKNHGP